MWLIKAISISTQDLLRTKLFMVCNSLRMIFSSSFPSFFLRGVSGVALTTKTSRKHVLAVLPLFPIHFSILTNIRHNKVQIFL